MHYVCPASAFVQRCEFIQELPEEKLAKTLRLSSDGKILIDRQEFEEHLLLKEME